MFYNSTVQHWCQHVGDITKMVWLSTTKTKTAKILYMYHDICQWPWSRTDGVMLHHLPIRKEVFTDKFIVLWDLWRDLILGLNLQFKYKIGCNWNVNGHQYKVQNNTFTCTIVPLTVTKPIVWNAGAFYLHSRGILIMTVQAQS